MGENTTPYIEYCSMWKSIVVVELMFYSLEKTFAVAWKSCVVKPYCTEALSLFHRKIFVVIYIYQSIFKNCKTFPPQVIWCTVNIPSGLFAYVVIVT